MTKTDVSFPHVDFFNRFYLLRNGRCSKIRKVPSTRLINLSRYKSFLKACLRLFKKTTRNEFPGKSEKETLSGINSQLETLCPTSVTLGEYKAANLDCYQIAKIRLTSRMLKHKASFICYVSSEQMIKLI